MKMYGEVGVKIHVFLTLALVGGQPATLLFFIINEHSIQYKFCCFLTLYNGMLLGPLPLPETWHM
jgi:hypothetical protein